MDNSRDTEHYALPMWLRLFPFLYHRVALMSRDTAPSVQQLLQQRQVDLEEVAAKQKEPRLLANISSL
eukprot:487698-Amphidinium_carterae.1